MGKPATFEIRSVVQRCIDGQQAAVRELIDRYQSMVFGLCFRMLRHREDAEDTTQETFHRVIRNLHRWDSDRKFEPWLLTIAGNRCRTKLAQRARKEAYSTLDFPVEDTKCQPEEGQVFEEVELAIRQLRQEYQEVFRLFHFQQESYEQISLVMNVPIGTVKTWCHRARKEVVDFLSRRKNLAF